MHFENSKRVLIFFSGLVIFTIASEFDDDCSSDLTLVRGTYQKLLNYLYCLDGWTFLSKVHTNKVLH